MNDEKTLRRNYNALHIWQKLTHIFAQEIFEDERLEKGVNQRYELCLAKKYKKQHWSSFTPQVKQGVYRKILDMFHLWSEVISMGKLACANSNQREKTKEEPSWLIPRKLSQQT